MRGKQLNATKMRNIFPPFPGVHGAVHNVYGAIQCPSSCQNIACLRCTNESKFTTVTHSSVVSHTC